METPQIKGATASPMIIAAGRMVSAGDASSSIENTKIGNNHAPFSQNSEQLQQSYEQ